jgi:predicted AlkP superfamily phosphohydrolase/phosphomutase
MSSFFVNCSPPRPSKAIVIGIDGADWKVIKNLWDQGRLPSLKALSDRGTNAILRTFYNSSPVIWTTIATGVLRKKHGITGFVVSGSNGDVPVSSEVRRVPAIWNMLSVSQRRVAVLNWWASWPAENVNGLVVSDRALLDRKKGIYPPGRRKAILDLMRTANDSVDAFGGEEIAERRDRLTAAVAAEIAGADYDLILAYFRSVDVVSHHYWKYYEPNKFAGTDSQSIELHGTRIRDAYEAVDAAIGRMFERAGQKVNFFVISDHGFHAKEEEELQIGLDFDRLLNELGFLEYGEKGVDMARTLLYTEGSGRHDKVKRLRFALDGRGIGGSVQKEDMASIRARLADSLAEVTYRSGKPVCKLRDPTAKELKRGADLVGEVLENGATKEILVKGRKLPDAIGWITSISGEHSPNTHGILIAAGPDIKENGAVAGISITDITPTLLYGMGLPVAEDFDGQARTDLYTQRFQSQHSLRTISSWGRTNGKDAVASEQDEVLIDELRALGYLD